MAANFDRPVLDQRMRAEVSSENSLDESLEYRLDAIGDGEGALNGLTKNDFAELFLSAPAATVV